MCVFVAVRSFEIRHSSSTSRTALKTRVPCRRRVGCAIQCAQTLRTDEQRLLLSCGVHIYDLPAIVCHEHKRSQQAVGVRNCLTDEGRPLGTGLQEQVPNHLRRLWAKAMVVNAEGKGLELPGQVTGKKRTAREPLMKCRK